MCRSGDRRQSKNFSFDAKLCGLLIVLLIPGLLYSDHKMRQDPDEKAGTANQTPAYPPGWENTLQNGKEHSGLQRASTTFIYILRPERAKNKGEKA